MSEISNLEIRDGSIRVTKKDRVESSTSSKGNQIKWRTSDGVWIKSDSMGYEGLAEAAASYVLSMSNIKNYVNYSMRQIYEEDTETIIYGCSSIEFLGKKDQLITVERLFEDINIDIYKKIETMSTEESLKYVIDIVTNITGLSEFGKWICMLIEFDAFILNEDRHFHNIAVIENNCKYSLMPIFDNGGSFLSDTIRDYPMSMLLRKAIKKVKSKPFSTDFNKQVKSAINISGQQFKISRSLIDKLKTKHITLYKPEEVRRVINILNIQMDRYNYILNTVGE